MQTHAEQVVAAVRGRLIGLLALRYGLLAASGWAFAWGTAVLVARVGWQADRLPLAWGAAGMVAAIVIGAAMAVRRAPTVAAVRALVDRRSHAGGLVMAGDEADLGDWRSRLGRAQAPTVTWRGGRAWLLFLAAGAFVGLAFALPHQITAIAQPNRALDIADEADRLEAQIETLEAERVLDEAEATDLRRKLDQVRAEASGTDPRRTWEALDHLEDTLAKTADEAAEQSIREAEALTDLRATAEDLERIAESSEAELDARDLADAMREMAEQLEAAAESSKMVKKLADAELMKALKELQGMDPEALKKAAEIDPDLAKQLEALAEAMEEVDADSLARVGTAGTVTVFDPDQSIKLDELRKGAPFKTDRAVRLTTEKVFKADPTVSLTVDLTAMGEGERVIALRELKKLAVYKLDETAPVDLSKLKADGEELIVIAEAGGPAKRYVYSAEETGRCEGCRKLNGKVFRIAAKAAQVRQAELKALMEAMAEQGLIDPEQLAQCRNACDGDGRPGRGGVNRGRGDADMTWRDESTQENTTWTAEALPPGAVDPENSTMAGVSLGAPQAFEGEAELQPGALSGAAAGGGSAQRHDVLPRHRRAVEAYFNRE